MKFVIFVVKKTSDDAEGTKIPVESYARCKEIIKYVLIYILCVIYLAVSNIIATFASDKERNIINH
nr:MAG TPA: hypothetical protein [Caudoviricetes sp.]